MYKLNYIFIYIMGENVSKYIPNFIYRNHEYDKQQIEEGILKFKETLTFLKNKIKYMNENVIKYMKEAKYLYEINNKSGAIHQLKLKKMYEKEIKKIESIQFTIEGNILHMESISVMLETVSTIKNSSSYIQLINNNLDISKVENIIESLWDQKETSNDIENILSENTSDEFDENELLEELQNYDSIISNLEIKQEEYKKQENITPEISINQKQEDLNNLNQENQENQENQKQEELNNQSKKKQKEQKEHTNNLENNQNLIQNPDDKSNIYSHLVNLLPVVPNNKISNSESKIEVYN